MSRRRPDPMNVKRARWARNALAVFTDETYGRRNPDTMNHADFGTAVQDLITDLLHLWNQRRKPRDLTPKELIDKATWMFDDEIMCPDFAAPVGRPTAKTVQAAIAKSLNRLSTPKDCGTRRRPNNKQKRT